jgi:hypothetical protein
MSTNFTKCALKVVRAFGIAMLIYGCSVLNAGSRNPKFRVIAFFTAKQDQAHISFVHEANRWFPEMATKYNFSYESTSDWQNLNSDTRNNTKKIPTQTRFDPVCGVGGILDF